MSVHQSGSQLSVLGVIPMSKPCAARMHAGCRETRETCSCPSCHLGPCSGCHASNLQALYEGLCASCERERVRSLTRQTTKCDNCGAADAFRNPGNRADQFYCIACQLATGETLALPVSISSLVAPQCMGKNIDDELHTWVHIRGTRFQCKCGTKRFSAKLRDKMRRAMMNS